MTIIFKVYYTTVDNQTIWKIYKDIINIVVPT